MCKATDSVFVDIKVLLQAHSCYWQNLVLCTDRRLAWVYTDLFVASLHPGLMALSIFKVSNVATNPSNWAPASVAQLVGCRPSCKQKGHWFNSRSGHMLGLQVLSPVRAQTEGRQSVFLSHIEVSFLLVLSPFPSLLKKN